MSVITIPAGMKVWNGGEEAPVDWDGGPYLCRDGKMYHMRGYGWGHGTHCWNPTADWDRIAYTPKATPDTDRLGGVGV
jgi:hypothetical protein